MKNKLGKEENLELYNKEGKLVYEYYVYSNGISVEKTYDSKGNILTYKNSGLDKTIAKIDLKHLILETDAPYLAPTPFRGQRNESKYIVNIAEKLAEVHQISIKEVAKVTTQNAKKLFRL